MRRPFLLPVVLLALILGAPAASAMDNDGDGWTTPDDCDDTDGTTYPGAPELADGRDNDCDGLVDEGVSDSDGDGWTVPDDCNDADPSVHPGAYEHADGIDNDCDGIVDNGPDADADGIPDASDNCDHAPNPAQANFDGDAYGDACDDTDADGLTDEDEFTLGSEPFVRDTDHDGLLDGDEVHVWGTDPVDADTDGDLHKDGTEVAAGSDALNPLSFPVAGGVGVALPMSPGALPVTDDFAPLR